MKNLLQTIALLSTAAVAVLATEPVCYGPTSSDLSGRFCSSKCGVNCVCDINPVCNNCRQLFAGCSSQMLRDGDLGFLSASPVPTFFIRGQDYGMFNVTSLNKRETIRDVCIQPQLPAGMYLNKTDENWVLSGNPQEVMPITNYTIIAKGSSTYISRMHVAFSVIEKCPEVFAVSNNGTCGGNLICREGDCCSRWNYCGSGDLFCGQGCKGGNCTTV